MAKPISDVVHEVRAGEEMAGGMLTIVLAARATLRKAGVQ